MFEHRPNITKDFILSRVTEEEIFKEFLGLTPDYTGTYCNPLRQGDDHPGCNFYIDSRGVIKFKDYAGGFNWDCFNVVEYAERVDFKKALEIVAQRFGLVSSTGVTSTRHVYTPKKPTARKFEIRIKKREWNKEDVLWWKQYHITVDILEYFRVKPIQAAWFLEDDGVLRLCYTYKVTDPCYAYHLVRREREQWIGMYDYKLYFPLRPKKGVYPRFIQPPINTLQGLDLLPPQGNNLILTKSYKDVITQSLFSKEFDFNSVAPLSETVVIEEELFKDLYNRFDFLATNFDFDKAGIRLMRKYEEKYRLPSLMFGSEYRTKGVKDFSDHVKIMGIDKTKELLDYVRTRFRVIM